MMVERRPSNVPNGPESSLFGRSQATQLRSQPSQHSFSQGVSSQHGMFSQLSQNSLDEILTTDQMIGSQERENPMKRISCLPHISYNREESQMATTRSSTNLMEKWKSTSVPDHRSQTTEEIEHRIANMETSLNRFGMILDFVQGDIMQVNKGIKEALMEMKGIRQKLITNDNFLQLMSKGQEHIKSNLAGGLKSLADQVSQDTHRRSLMEISSVISALREKIEVCLQKLKYELCKTVSKEMQAVACSLKMPSQKHPTPTILSAKDIRRCATPKKMPSLKIAEVHPNIEVGSWTSVRAEQATFRCRGTSKEHKQNRLSAVELEREWRIPIESDEEMDGAFSCLLEAQETGKYSTVEAKEETERILRKARRRKRKHCNPIILN